MQNAGGDQPAGAGLEAVGLAEIEDAIVSFIPALQAAANIGLGCARLQAEKSVGEVVADRIELRREIIRLRFSLLTHERRLSVILMHVKIGRASCRERV